MLGYNCAVLILNYNDEERVVNLAKKLESYGVFDKIVIVDNHSESCEMIKELKGDIYLKVFSEENGGFAKGNNLGFRALKPYNPDVVLTINSDIDVSKDNILYCLEYMKNHDKCAACSIRMFEKGKLAQNYYQIPSGFNTIFHTCDILKLCKKDVQPEEFKTGYVRESCAFYSYKKFEEIGFYDEDFFMYEEGPSSGLSFQRAGYYEAIIGDESRFYYHNHIGPIFTKKRSKIFKESRLKFLKKYKRGNALSRLIIKIFW